MDVDLESKIKMSIVSAELEVSTSCTNVDNHGSDHPALIKNPHWLCLPISSENTPNGSQCPLTSGLRLVMLTLLL